MTPLRTIPQHVNDAPYTTPAKKKSKIGSRAYCRNVISSRPLFRTSLNISLHIAVEQFIHKQTNSTHLAFSSFTIKVIVTIKNNNLLAKFFTYSVVTSIFFKFMANLLEHHCCHIQYSHIRRPLRTS